MKRHPAVRAILLLSSVLTITLLSKSSPLYPLNDWVDANCFLTTGKSILAGNVLYRDVYEQKGPVLYFLHALAAIISDSSFLGVWILEILSCFAFTLFGWQLVARRCSNASIFVIPGLLLLTFSTISFASGDSAEEFSLPLITYSFVSGMQTDWKHELPSTRQTILIGMTCALVFWIKYTLCGFYIALILFVLAAAIYQKKMSSIPSLALAFLGGFLLASLPVMIYFIWHHALSDLWSAYFLNNIFLYSPASGGRGGNRGASRGGMLSSILSFASMNPVFVILFLLGLVYALWRHRMEALFLLVSLTGCLPFIALGTRPYPYYAFILAAFTVYGWIPVCRLLDVLPLLHFSLRSLLSVVLSCLMGIYAFQASLNTYLLLTPRDEMPQYQFAQIIHESENPTLLNYGFLDGGFYTAAGLTPASRFFCKLNLNLPEMNQALSESVMQGKTTYVVTRDRELDKKAPYELISHATWPYQSNAESPRPFTYYLYRLISR